MTLNILILGGSSSNSTDAIFHKGDGVAQRDRDSSGVLLKDVVGKWELPFLAIEALRRQFPRAAGAKW